MASISAARRLPLPVKSRMSLTGAACARLRTLGARFGLGSIYLLVVLQERLDDYSDRRRRNAAFEDFTNEYKAPRARQGDQNG